MNGKAQSWRRLDRRRIASRKFRRTQCWPKQGTFPRELYEGEMREEQTYDQMHLYPNEKDYERTTFQRFVRGWQVCGAEQCGKHNKGVAKNFLTMNRRRPRSRRGSITPRQLETDKNGHG